MDPTIFEDACSLASVPGDPHLLQELLDLEQSSDSNRKFIDGLDEILRTSKL